MWTVPTLMRKPPKFPKFASRLLSARLANSLSRLGMAHKLGVTLKQYALWEYGYEMPDDDTLLKINRILFSNSINDD